MAFRASTRLLPQIARQRTTVSWAGAHAVGLVVANWPGHRDVGTRGDIRTRIRLGFCRFLSLHIAKHPMHLTPPQSPPQWNHSADEILKLTKEAIEYDRAIQDKVGGLDPKDCTFDSVSCNAVMLYNPGTRMFFRLGIRKSKPLKS